MNCWDLSKELIGLLVEYDNKVAARAKEKLMDKWLMLDADIIRIEGLIFAIKNQLKNIEC